MSLIGLKFLFKVGITQSVLLLLVEMLYEELLFRCVTVFNTGLEIDLCI